MCKNSDPSVGYAREERGRVWDSFPQRNLATLANSSKVLNNRVKMARLAVKEEEGEA